MSRKDYCSLLVSADGGIESEVEADCVIVPLTAFEPINHLYVTDLRTGHTLQTFSNLDNPWMHLEYDNGYLVGPTGMSQRDGS